MRSEGSAGQALGHERANGLGQGHLGGQGPVHSYDEWSPLRNVVVGRGEHFNCYHIDSSFKLFYLENVEPIIGADSALQRYVRLPAWVIDQLCEDLEGLVDALRDYGAVVQRPVEAAQAEIATPFWSSRSTPALNIRDQTLILGDTIVETAPHVRARYFENDLLKPLFQGYFARGANWLSMPRPALARDSLDASYYATRGFETAHLSADGGAGELKGLVHEMVFDGAQCIRLGRDVLVNVANANHQLGYEWLLRTFGEEFRFHRLAGLADNHIDSVMLPLRPGLMLLRNPTYRDHLPKPLRGWKFVYPPDVTEHRFPDYGNEGFNLASRFIDMNVLSLDEDTVVVNALYPELIDTLEEEGLEVVPVRHRHRRLFSGGFHCFTLDCVRAGGAEDYLG